MVEREKLKEGIGVEEERLKVIIGRIRADARMPRYQTSGASGMDVHAVEEYTLKPGERTLIETGLRFALSEGYEIQVRSRSGLAVKYGFSVLNSPGTVDSDYRGELKVIGINQGEEDFKINLGMRVAQIVFAPVVRVNLEEELDLDSTNRGEAGFGSTGEGR